MAPWRFRFLIEEYAERQYAEGLRFGLIAATLHNIHAGKGARAKQPEDFVTKPKHLKKVEKREGDQNWRIAYGQALLFAAEHGTIVSGKK